MADTKNTVTNAVSNAAASGGTAGTPGDATPAGADLLAWSVGAVADRLDLAPSTLRTWDRRYGIGPSQRTEGGHRRYDEVDIQRVRLMAQLTGRGVPAHGGARRDVHRRTGPRVRARPRTRGSTLGEHAAESTIEAIISSAAALDADGLSRLYQRVTRESDLISAGPACSHRHCDASANAGAAAPSAWIRSTSPANCWSTSCVR